MNQQTDKAILVVSFGTSYEASRKATIEKIEQDIRNAFQDHRIYRAWTSKFIISILKKRDNYTVPTVKEALEQMITDGIENNIMKEEVLSYKESFDKIAFGTPLLADSKDESQAINAVTTEFSDLKETEALVFMGHGTTHQVNTGNFLQPNQKLLKPGTYSFDLNINNLTYEFEFNVSEDENNGDVENKIARLINRSNIGLNCEVKTDSLENKGLVITSDATGISGIHSTIFSIKSDNSELINTLGMDRVSSYPYNAIFSVNGSEQYSPSNEFMLNKTFSVKLKETTDEPVTLSLNTDDNSIADSIDELISGYNGLVKITESDNNKIFEGNDRLKLEFSRIASKYRTTLNNNGLKVEDDGSVSVDRQTVIESAHNGTIDNIFNELNNFKSALMKKAEDISTNPMNYVNNKIVAYKNPKYAFNDPYNLSAYSGMMFNDYC